MKARTRSKWRLFAALIIASALIGSGYAVLLDVAIRSEFSAYSFLRGALRGAMIGVIVLSFEAYLARSPLGERIRRANFATSLAIHTAASTAVLMAAVVLSRALLSSRGHSMEQWLSIGFLRDSGFALIIVFAIHFVIQVRRIVGGRVLANFVLGRYHRPKKEDRIFMFLDIAGSTRMAERLGDTGAHLLISRFFLDIAEPVLEFDGETHRYIGDEVVVTWPMADGVSNARCLRCYAAICDRIAAVSPSYEKEFGIVPRFRVGLHGGPVVAGECGDDKKEIVYFGDTINTAKRLEEACRDFDQPILISGDLLARINLPDGFVMVDLGPTALRERNQKLEIYGVSQHPAG